MANSPQAIKRARQNNKCRMHNNSIRSNLRTHIKKLVKVSEGDSGEASAQQARRTTSTIDKAASKGVIHRNKAARLKSRLNKKLKAQSGK